MQKATFLWCPTVDTKSKQLRSELTDIINLLKRRGRTMNVKELESWEATISEYHVSYLALSYFDPNLSKDMKYWVSKQFKEALSLTKELRKSLN